jgi:hypothetical protein
MEAREKVRCRMLKREASSLGWHVLHVEQVAKGFPDLLLASALHNITVYIEAKVSRRRCASKEHHLRLASKMQIWWLQRLPHSFLVVYDAEIASVYWFDEQMNGFRFCGAACNTEQLLNVILKESSVVRTK